MKYMEQQHKLEGGLCHGRMSKDLINVRPVDLYPNFWDNVRKNKNRRHNFHTDRGKRKLSDKYSVNSKACKKGEKIKLDTIEQKQIRNLNSNINSYY